MRKTSTITAGGIRLALSTVSSLGIHADRTVKNPPVSYARGATIDVGEVTLSDSATILDINATFHPGYWIKIAKESYLEADGNKYAMTGTEGITPDTEFWMPESGKASFRLIFNPLPADTRTLSFIEGDAPGAFRLIDIDLSGEPMAEFPQQLPAELRKEPVDGPVPDPALCIGTTTLHYHLLPYRDDVAGNLIMYVNTMYGSQDEYPLLFDSEGNATVTIDQYGNAEAFVIDSSTGSIYSSATLYPGEDLDIYIDARISGSTAMQNRDERPSRWLHRALHNGHYADLDRMKETYPNKWKTQLYNGQFGDYRMTAREYMDMVKDLHRSNGDSIRKADLPQMAKELFLLTLDNDLSSAIARYMYFLGLNYRDAIGDWRAPMPLDSIKARLTDDDFREAATWFDLSNPKLLMESNLLAATDWNAYGVKGDLSKSMTLFAEKADKARHLTLTAEDLDTLRQLSNPFFAEACDSIYRRGLAKVNGYSGQIERTPTPEVADDEIFDAIISEHKGKVVLVDLWNTWCGPCRMAIKENEPLKSGELSDPDIVWVYIADESSDPVKYVEMIQNIKGIHYKLTEPQIEKIRKRFEVDGIPYYILVDRDGNASGHPDFRDHTRMVEEVKIVISD